MLVQLDADARWALDASLIPTGNTESLTGKYDLRKPRPLGADTYDDAFRMAPVSPVMSRRRARGSSIRR